MHRLLGILGNRDEEGVNLFCDNAVLNTSSLQGSYKWLALLNDKDAKAELDEMNLLIGSIEGIRHMHDQQQLAGAPATLPQENRIAKVSSKEEAKGAKEKQMAGSSHPVARSNSKVKAWIERTQNAPQELLSFSAFEPIVSESNVHSISDGKKSAIGSQMKRPQSTEPRQQNLWYLTNVTAFTV